MIVATSLGARTLGVFRAFGHAAFFFVDLVRAIPSSLRRFGLVVAQIHAIGNLSLVIILSSGLAVGFVLALQMYYALVAYGAAESLGLIVNLALVRELGPVVTALLFAGRAGTSLTAEIMASTDPETRQFVHGEPDGPVKFHYPAPTLAEDFGVGV